MSLYRLATQSKILMIFEFFRFICIDTIEQHILEIQSRKIAIAQNALDGDKQKFANHPSLEDMKKMFGLEDSIHEVER